MLHNLLSMNMAQVGEIVNGLADMGMDAVANIANLTQGEETTMTSLSPVGAGDRETKPPASPGASSPQTGRKNKAFLPEPGFGLHCLEFSTVIGTGTFGRVLVCRHSTAGQYYALKILSIAEVIRLKQIEHVKNEKSILLSVSHPFIVNLHWASHDNTFLYMLLEYVPGGELFSYLRSAGRFNNATGNFYAAEILTALDYLHNLSIIYRDLKPENLLLDKEGHIKITDFGFAKCLEDRTWTLCGTPEYLAPEIIQSKGHNKAVDWWALGILIYEMLAGYPPFFDDNPFAIYEKILQGKVEWPKHIDPIAKDIIKKLLVLDRTKRLGNMKNGTDDVKRHRWFKPINWDDVVERKMQPPIIPKVAHEGDTRCFDSYPDDDWHNRPAVGSLEQKLFHDF